MTRLLHELVGHLRAVEQIDVVARPLAADVGQRTGLLQRLAARPAGRDDHCVAQLGEREKVAAVQRQLHDFAVLDDIADLGGRRLQQRRDGLDDHLFGDALHAERELEIERAPDFEGDAAQRLRREPGHRHANVPLADPQRWKKKAALVVGDAFDRRAAGRVYRGDGCAGQHAARAVFDDPADLTGVELGKRRAHRAQQQTGDHPPEDDEHAASLTLRQRGTCKHFVKTETSHRRARARAPATASARRVPTPATCRCGTSLHAFGTFSCSVAVGVMNANVWLRTLTSAIVCSIFGMWQATHSPAGTAGRVMRVLRDRRRMRTVRRRRRVARQAEIANRLDQIRVVRRAVHVVAAEAGHAAAVYEALHEVVALHPVLVCRCRRRNA